MERNLLKTKTNKSYHVDLAKLPDRKIKYEFAKEMYFDEMALRAKSSGDHSLIRLLESAVIMAGSLEKKRSSEPKTGNPMNRKQHVIYLILVNHVMG